jgi:demethylmacrocin O-methyltransferase
MATALSGSFSNRLGTLYHAVRAKVEGWRRRNDLDKLALRFGTDKWGSHWYTQHYERYFRSRRHRELTLLEIGVGGYHDIERGAESLRMWKAYFRRARIAGIDLQDKTRFSEPRIDIRQCEQTNTGELMRLCDEYAGFDIIIDDGSHRNEDVIRTFQILFPRLRSDGIYAVEDTQTAYWPTWGGGIGHPRSSMSYFKALADGLNHVEYPVVDYQPSYFDRHIVEIAFFHNLVIIRKGNNTEPTNIPALVEREIALGQRLGAGEIGAPVALASTLGRAR